MRWQTRSRGRRALLFVLFCTALPTAPVGAAESAGLNPGQALRLLDNDYYKININIRARVELADFETLESSQAYTIRTRAGIGAKPVYGLSAYAELQNTLSLADGQYFDTVEPPTGQSPIADPEDTDLHQLYARYQNADFFGVDVTVGRQRIVLDDQRFIGNVGWRQNEQVYDAVRASTTLGVPHLNVLYGYVNYVSRIFGNEGPPAMRNYRSDSHLLRVGYDAWPWARIAAFAYLLDFDNSAANSSNSFGLRITGGRPLTSLWSLSWAASYAVQTDAANNPVDYVAHYVAAEAGATRQNIAGLALGYEMLGSDDGKARFVTPLATGHKFNGWADAFLDNGGPNGLRDLYAAVTPQLPWELESGIIYHHFWSDEGGDSLGYELDGVLSRAFGRYITVLAKMAYFDGRTETLPDRWRAWVEATFNF